MYMDIDTYITAIDTHTVQAVPRDALRRKYSVVRRLVTVASMLLK